MSTVDPPDVRTCRRCGGLTVYRRDAMVPGDPGAPRGSNRSVAHHQPAWSCVSCGHLEPEERRALRSGERQPT